MTNMTFSRQMNKLQRVFKEVEREKLAIYHEKLQDLSDDVFIEATETIMVREDWFPSIACVRRYARAGDEQTNCGEDMVSRIKKEMARIEELKQQGEWEPFTGGGK